MQSVRIWRRRHNEPERSTMSISVKTFPSANEAAQALSADRTARFLGGGTLIMRAVNEGDQSFSTIIRANDPVFTQIQPQGDRIVIGAGLTMSQILASRELEFLHAAARVVGGPAIRNMATVGGNLFAAHPYGDLATFLLAVDANVSVAGGSGGRETPLAEFLRDRDREPRPVVLSVTVTRPQHGALRFKKVSRVKPKGISMMTIAANLPQQSGRVTGARIAYGSMGPVPMRIAAVEQALEGKSLDEAGIAQAVGAATAGLEPPTDAIASSWYRREVAPVHLKRLLLERQGI